jgi:hypothetical protein
MEINNSRVGNAPNAANTSAIINVTDTKNALRAIVDGINTINKLPQTKPFDPVQFLTDSRKVLQHVNTVAKVIGTNTSLLVLPEVILTLFFMHKNIKSFAER